DDPQRARFQIGDAVEIRRRAGTAVNATISGTPMGRTKVGMGEVLLRGPVSKENVSPGDEIWMGGGSDVGWPSSGSMRAASRGGAPRGVSPRLWEATGFARGKGQGCRYRADGLGYPPKGRQGQECRRRQDRGAARRSPEGQTDRGPQVRRHRPPHIPAERRERGQVRYPCRA